MSRLSIRIAIALLALTPAVAIAQKNCVKGKPCGNTCIARDKTCHITAGPTRPVTPPPAPAAPSVPADAQFVASSRGQVYYWIGCSAWKSLSRANLRFFKTRDQAVAAGYRPSASAGCAGPAAPAVPDTPSPATPAAAPPAAALGLLGAAAATPARAAPPATGGRTSAPGI